ncbi:hypothetical protein PMAYCL1PPCAC_09473, partial [Pristionchus mayeri]
RISPSTMQSLLAFVLLVTVAKCEIAIFNSCNETVQVIRNGFNLTELGANRLALVTDDIPKSGWTFKIGDEGRTEARFRKESKGLTTFEINIVRGFDVPMLIKDRMKSIVCEDARCFGKSFLGKTVTSKKISSRDNEFILNFCPQ